MAFGVFHNVSAKTYFKWRLPIATAWACFAGLCVTIWEIMFREGYPLNASLFFGLWALMFVFSMIVFDVLDIVTAFVPAQLVPFCMFTWMIPNGKSKSPTA